MTTIGSSPPSPEFTVGNEAVDGRVVVAVAGEVDLATADTFRAALEEASKRGPVTLDLEQCAFLDSCALGIIAAVAEVAKTNGKLAVSNVHGPVLRTLEMTGILTWDSIIHSDPSEDGHGATG